MPDGSSCATPTDPNMLVSGSPHDAGLTTSVAVVLGAKLKAGGHPSLTLRRRVRRGCALYRKGAVSALVLSGGGEDSQKTEAEAMADLAVAAGVPHSCLVLETLSKNTRQNAALSILKLHELGKYNSLRVIVVTDNYHMPRALLLFSRAVRGCPWTIEGCFVPGPRRRRGWWQGALREIPALLLDAIRGRMAVRRLLSDQRSE